MQFETAFSVTNFDAETMQVISDVFETMLSSKADRVEARPLPQPPFVTAAIHFAGSYRGAVILACSNSTVCWLTGRICRADPPSSVNEDALDAISELVNMIGGNLKALLPSGTALSLPSVVDGKDYFFRVSNEALRRELTFESEGRSFWVTLVEMAEEE